MRIQYVSDLHLEHWKNRVPAVADRVDCVVIAGDTSVPLQSSLIEIRRTIDRSVPVVTVAGNHEFYRTEMPAELEQARLLAKQLGIRINETRTSETETMYTGLITIKTANEAGETNTVSGTLNQQRQGKPAIHAPLDLSRKIHPAEAILQAEQSIARAQTGPIRGRVLQDPDLVLGVERLVDVDGAESERRPELRMEAHVPRILRARIQDEQVDAFGGGERHLVGDAQEADALMSIDGKHARAGSHELLVEMRVVVRLPPRRPDPDDVAAQIVRADRSHPSIRGRNDPRAPSRENVEALMFASTAIARIAERSRDSVALASFDGERERGRRALGDGEAAAAKQFRHREVHARPPALVILGFAAHRQHLEQARIPELGIAPVLDEGAVER